MAMRPLFFLAVAAAAWPEGLAAEAVAPDAACDAHDVEADEADLLQLHHRGRSRGAAEGAEGAAEGAEGARGAAAEAGGSAADSPGCRRRRSAASQAGMAMSFEGGGFKALGCYTGLTAGLLAAKGQSRLGDADGLFSEVGSLFSNSGGSWFVGLLAYAKKYESMVERMSVELNNSGIMYLDFLEPFILSLATSAVLRVELQMPKSLGKTNAVTGGFDPGSIIEILAEFVYAAGFSTDWAGFVEHLFLAADLPTDAQLAAEPNAFARGKLWSAMVNVVSLGGTGTGTCSGGFCLFGGNTTILRNNQSKTLGYSVGGEPSKSLPNFIPSAFSTIFGRGTDDAPLPFCAPKAPCGNLIFDEKFTKGSQETRYASAPADAFEAAYVKNAGKLPVAAVAGASSAFLGGLVTVDLWGSNAAATLADTIADTLAAVFSLSDTRRQEVRQAIFNALTTNWAMWSTTKTDGSAFKAGQAWRELAAIQQSTATPEQVQAMADDRLHALVDGGYSDNAAAAAAIAAGHKEIVMWMDGIDSLWTYFTGTPPTNNCIPGLPVSSCPFCYTPQVIFRETVAEAQQLFNASVVTLALPVPSVEGLADVYYGSFQATTIDNSLVGVEGGRSVTLHVLHVASSTPIGGFGYRAYSTMANQIVRTLALPANRAVASEMWRLLSGKPLQ